MRVRTPPRSSFRLAKTPENRGFCIFDRQVRSRFRSIWEALLRFVLRIFLAVDRQMEMLVRDLQVVLLHDPLAVPQPRANHVDREPFGQFGLAARPQVVPQAGPGPLAGTGDELLAERSQIHRPLTPLGACIAVDEPLEHVLGSFCGSSSVNVSQQRAQLRRQRIAPHVSTFNVFRLGAPHVQPSVLHIDVRPSPAQWFGRSPQPRVAGQTGRRLLR